LKRRFSNLLYLDLELFSIFGERNRILYTNGIEDICIVSSATEHHDQEFSTSCANVINSGADFVKWFAENFGQIIDYLSTPTFSS